MKHKRDLLLLPIGDISKRSTMKQIRNTCFEYENILMNFHYETTVFGLDDEGNQSLNSSYTANYLVSESESEIESEKRERERERERERDRKKRI